MVCYKSVIYLPLSFHGQIIHLHEEMITRWPEDEKGAQRAPLSPTWQAVHQKNAFIQQLVDGYFPINNTLLFSEKLYQTDPT